jgi:hypothetical protein
MTRKNTLGNTRLKTATAIVKHLEADLDAARKDLPSGGHDDEEALLTTLERALDAAKNVLRGILRND